MSIPNEALQRLLQEIEQKAQSSQRDIAVVKAQMAGKRRERRMLQLTADELASLPADANVYEGVGKMFVLSPTAELQGKLKAHGRDLDGDVVNLDKKLHYLEMTAKNSREHIEQMLKSGGRA